MSPLSPLFTAMNWARATSPPAHTRRAMNLSRRPRLVIAGSLRTLPACQDRTGRTVSAGRSRQIGQMRLFPFARRVSLGRRRNVDDMMNPAMPLRRDARGLDDAVVDDPASLKAERRIDLSADGPVVTVALLVRADQFPEAPGPQLRAEGLAIPPGEHLQQKLFHARTGWGLARV